MLYLSVEHDGFSVSVFTNDYEAGVLDTGASGGDQMAGKHWVQYHTPDLMGYGINECNGVFAMLTSKDCGLHDPIDDVAWLVPVKFKLSLAVPG